MERLNCCVEEYLYLLSSVEGYHFSGAERFIQRLYDVNRLIWDLEFDIRSGRDTDLSYIGSKTLEIRNLNRVRIGIKNEIVELSRLGFKDIKMNHLSA